MRQNQKVGRTSGVREYWSVEPLEVRRLLSASAPIEVDNDAAALAGYWQPKTNRQGYLGSNYLEDDNTAKGQSTVTWSANLSMAGRYEVQIRYIAASGNASAVPVEVRTGAEVVRWSLDQRFSGSQWVSLGQYDFNTSGTVMLSNAGTSGWVNADAVRFVPLNAAAGPGNLTATPGSRGQIRLNWSDNATGETGYRVERSATPDFASVVGVDLPANSTRHTFTSIADGATCYFRVRSFGPGTVVSEWSNTSGRTMGVPDAPSGVRLTTLSPTSVRLSWEDNAWDEALFEIQRSTRADFASVAGFTTAANVTRIDLTGQPEGQIFYYRVRAANEVGRSAWSLPVQLAAAATAPVAPSGLVVSDIQGSPGMLRITWTDRSDNETAFILERSTSASFDAFTSITLSANTSAYLDQGLDEWTVYHYRVRAVGVAGEAASDSDWNRTAEDSDYGSTQVVPTQADAPDWTVSSTGLLTDSGVAKGELTHYFAPPPESQMYYRVEYVWTPATTGDAAVPVLVDSWHPGHQDRVVYIDQRVGGSIDLGVVYEPIISISNGGTSGVVVLGGLRYTPVKASEVVDVGPGDVYGGFSQVQIGSHQAGNGSIGFPAYVAPPANGGNFAMTAPLAPQGHYGMYEVYIRYKSDPTFATQANFNIGMNPIPVDQTKDGDKWVRLGVAIFDVDGTSQGVSLTSIGANGPVSIDAVLFRPLAYFA